MLLVSAKFIKILELTDFFSDELDSLCTFVVVFTQPDAYFLGTRVHQRHQRDLKASLFQIALIDAYGVNPQDAISMTAKCRAQGYSPGSAECRGGR